MGTIISSIEYYLPEKIVTNQDLENENPSWKMDDVESKSGVRERHIAEEDETAFDLSKVACDKLFAKSIDKNEIDCLIYCTQSPDFIMPPNSYLLHKYLGLSDKIMAYDFNMACSGYVYGLSMAHSFLLSGLAKKVLLVNADTYSKYINKGDRSARTLFGDGASASIIEINEQSKGFLTFDFVSSGKDYEKFYIPAGGCRLPRSTETQKEISNQSGNSRSSNNIHMDGMGVWSFINSLVPKQIKSFLKSNNLEISDIDLFVFHQASKMTLDSIIKMLKLDKDKVFINLNGLGNTVSASIPIALKDAMDQGKISKGDKILLAGFGVGMSYAATIIEF